MKNKSIQGLRAMFAIGVCLSHCYFLKDYPQSASIFNSVFSKLAFVSFFFMISGFFSANMNEGLKFRDYLKKKLIRIYPLHLIVLLLMLFYSVVQNGFSALNSIKKIITLVLNALLLQTWSFDLSTATSYNTVSWFLSSLLFCYIAGYWILRFVNKKAKRWTVVYIITAALVIFKSAAALHFPTDNAGGGGTITVTCSL